ncbi:MAG: monovalent cation/H+ antiporter subunit A [Gammaproteobacteria bacterium]|nr:monovalent cation/H+ antiporter subunit A [Gammaproteobacteria bacterium]MBU0770578.1 monovalent cation/H+ antiporter subunit A [Gammaproteobacteria bacterium]MBU0857535.1 monovalent cation/H+ antiporter subunit A [Gammaproteobacteria bacterium]MBU1845173.1 monovalent cation/H+ antiporter subunit A [Gammaproteobacteria bacterium]
MNPLATIVLLPLVAGTLLCFSFGRDNSAARRTLTAFAAGAVTLLALSLLLSLAPQVMAGQTLLAHTDWVPSLGLSIGWRLDGLALLFALLITGIGLLIVIYAHFYLGEADPAGKFYTLLMLFMAAMLGVVMSDNIMLLVVFWELTSVSSFLLVGYWGHRADARDGARMALAITGGGGLVMLAGFVLLGQIAGTYELSELLTRGDVIKADPMYPLMLVLVLVGCFTKSAQVPFHFWLPEAMAAPTPVSAYLHSATMVKAGVFLMARLYPALGGTGLFEGIVASFGLATMAFAAWVAIFRHDLKALLAYSTISHLGLITFLIGLNSPLSAVAAVFHVLNHATFKAALFMSAGIIDHETGTRDLRRLGGLLRLMPWTATFAMTAAASMAGIPLFNGFLSKEMFFHEAVEASMFWGAAVPVVAALGGVFSMAYSVRFVHDVFFNGPPKELPHAHPHDPPLGMLAPVALLAVLCVVVGVLPALTYGPLVQAAASAMLGTAPPAYHLAIWHGLNLPLLMSAIAVVAGIGLYVALLRPLSLHDYTPRGWSGKATFTCMVERLFAFAGRLTSRIENGSLQRSMALMVALTVLLAGAPFYMADSLPGAGTRALMPAPPLALALWALLLVSATVLVLTHHRRFQALVLTGVVGLVTALTFVALSAPDLALTQLSVEVVSTVILLMGLALLPQRSPLESGALRRGRDAVLALAAGGGIAGFAWLMLTRNHESISWFFLDKALSEGGGTNVVNVILVDFRGYDTFGEITVLGIAAVGVLALLDGFRTRRPAADEQGRSWQFEQQPLLLRFAARLVLPLALIVSAYIFWRGHNMPGGGFIAGLITAVALVLQYMALGQARAEMLLHGAAGRRFTRWIGSGLSIAGLTGIAAFLFGRPFLTSAHGHPHVPVLGDIPLASAAMFDLGVYITVVGATLLTLSVLGAASKEQHA